MFQNSPGSLLFFFPKHGFSLRGYAGMPGCRADHADFPGTPRCAAGHPHLSRRDDKHRHLPCGAAGRSPDATKIFSIQNHQFLKVKRRLPRAFSFSPEIRFDQLIFPDTDRIRRGNSPRRPLLPARSGFPAPPLAAVCPSFLLDSKYYQLYIPMLFSLYEDPGTPVAT